MQLNVKPRELKLWSLYGTVTASKMRIFRLLNHNSTPAQAVPDLSQDDISFVASYDFINRL